MDLLCTKFKHDFTKTKDINERMNKYYMYKNSRIKPKKKYINYSQLLPKNAKIKNGQNMSHKCILYTFISNGDLVTGAGETGRLILSASGRLPDNLGELSQYWQCRELF